MFLINSSPIVILANYRTGSSALCRSIASLNNLKPFVEPFSPYVKRHQDFVRYYKKKKNSNFVVKFMPDHIDLFQLYQELLSSDCFKIKLTRKNKVDQITSYYIAKTRNIWKTLDTDIKEEYTIPINKNKIISTMLEVMHLDKEINKINIKFDIEVTYEDLGTIKHTNRTKTHMPSNVLEIKKIVEQEMDKLNG